MARQKHQLCDPFHLQAVIDEHRALNTSLQQMADIRCKRVENILFLKICLQTIYISLTSSQNKIKMLRTSKIPII